MSIAHFGSELSESSPPPRDPAVALHVVVINERQLSAQVLGAVLVLQDFDSHVANFDVLFVAAPSCGLPRWSGSLPCP
eukprot:6349977-Pyramimonas_sp.AAC.1